MNFEGPSQKEDPIIAPEIKKRFAEKLHSEPSLNFMPKMIKELPNLDFYLVGGMVRDTLLKEPASKDYDFIARGVKPDKMAAVLSKYGHIELVGKSFGVYKFVPNKSTLKEAIDIAIPRTEESTAPGSYRSFKIVSDHTLPVTKDLDRRDLTINAIAWDVKEKRLIDPHNGITDLHNRIIRCVGDPRKRFEEDYSRMMRAIRFACQFDFAIEEKTWTAIKELMPHINDTYKEDGKKLRVVPREIISREIQKAMLANPVKSLNLLASSGALTHLLPEVEALQDNTEVWEALRDKFAHIGDMNFHQEFPRIHVKSTLLFSIMFNQALTDKKIAFGKKRPTKIKSMYNAMHLTNKQKEVIDFILKNQTKAPAFKSLVEDERLFFGPHGEDLLMFLYIQSTENPDDTTYNSIKQRIATLKRLTDDKGKLPAPLLDGKEIMATLAINKGGAIIGRIQSELRERQLSGKISSKKKAVEWIRKKFIR